MVTPCVETDVRYCFVVVSGLIACVVCVVDLVVKDVVLVVVVVFVVVVVVFVVCVVVVNSAIPAAVVGVEK